MGRQPSEHKPETVNPRSCCVRLADAWGLGGGGTSGVHQLLGVGVTFGFLAKELLIDLIGWDVPFAHADGLQTETFRAVTRFGLLRTQGRLDFGDRRACSQFLRRSDRRGKAAA